MGERVARLVQRFADAPVVYRPDPGGPPEGLPVDGARVSTFIFNGLFQNDGWPGLGQQLARIEAGDLGEVANTRVGTAYLPAYWPISRESGIMPGDPAEIDAVAGPAPVMGPGRIRENRFSAMLDVPVEPRDRPVNAAGAPPILVIASRWDVATSYVWALSLSTNLDSGVLVTWNGATHAVLSGGGDYPCLERIASDYLDDIATPSRAEGARCDTATLAASYRSGSRPSGAGWRHRREHGPAARRHRRRHPGLHRVVLVEPATRDPANLPVTTWRDPRHRCRRGLGDASDATVPGGTG